jgi:hypothetical protein
MLASRRKKRYPALDAVLRTRNIGLNGGVQKQKPRPGVADGSSPLFLG